MGPVAQAKTASQWVPPEQRHLFLFFISIITLVYTTADLLHVEGLVWCKPLALVYCRVS